MAPHRPAPDQPAPDQHLPVDYRLAPTLVVRFVGAYLVLLAVVIFAATAAVYLTGLPPDLLVILLLVGVVGVFWLAWWLRARAYVVRCEADGYRVRLIRGAGTTRAGWKEVEDAVTASPRGIPCLVLRLKDGRTTTLPVQAIATDREQFVRELQSHLQRGQGLRPL